MLDTIYNPERLQPFLIVISGPAGVGKDAVIQKMEEIGIEFQFVVTVNTRPPRKNEVPGKDYEFISRQEFEEMIKRDELLEYAKVYNDYKGIPKTKIRQAIASKEDVVVRVDVQGAATIHSKYPDALSIFLVAESEEILDQRIHDRGEDSEDRQKARHDMLPEEMKRLAEFDYVVVNRQNFLSETAEMIRTILQVERHRANPRKISL